MLLGLVVKENSLLQQNLLQNLQCHSALQGEWYSSYLYLFLHLYEHYSFEWCNFMIIISNDSYFVYNIFIKLNFRYSKTSDNRPFYSKYLQFPDGENIIFVSPSISCCLSFSNEMYLDATYRNLPTHPQFTLLLVIHVSAFKYVSLTFILTCFILVS